MFSSLEHSPVTLNSSADDKEPFNKRPGLTVNASLQEDAAQGSAQLTQNAGYGLPLVTEQDPGIVTANHR